MACGKPRAFVWSEVSEDGLVILFPSPKCRTCLARTGAVEKERHLNGNFCTGNGEGVLSEYDKFIAERVQKIEKEKANGVPEDCKGIKIKLENGERHVKLFREFRSSPEVLEIKTKIIGSPGFLNAAGVSEDWLVGFMGTALSDGLEKHLPKSKTYAGVTKLVKKLCIDGIGVFGLLDSNTAKELFLQILSHSSVLRDAVESLRLEVVGMQLTLVEHQGAQEVQRQRVDVLQRQQKVTAKQNAEATEICRKLELRSADAQAQLTKLRVTLENYMSDQTMAADHEKLKLLENNCNSSFIKLQQDTQGLQSGLKQVVQEVQEVQDVQEVHEMEIGLLHKEVGELRAEVRSGRARRRSAPPVLAAEALARAATAVSRRLSSPSSPPAHEEPWAEFNRDAAAKAKATVPAAAVPAAASAAAAPSRPKQKSSDKPKTPFKSPFKSPKSPFKAQTPHNQAKQDHPSRAGRSDAANDDNIEASAVVDDVVNAVGAVSPAGRGWFLRMLMPGHAVSSQPGTPQRSPSKAQTPHRLAL